MPDLTQCIEREREARTELLSRAQAGEVQHLSAVVEARAATDEAVRAVEGLLARVETMMTYGASLSETASMLAAIRQTLYPAPTAQGESTGGEGDEH